MQQLTSPLNSRRDKEVGRGLTMDEAAYDALKERLWSLGQEG